MKRSTNIQRPWSSDWLNIGGTERLISLIGGTVMLIYGIKNMRKLSGGSLMSTLAGGYFALRGATGRNRINNSFGWKITKPSESIRIEENMIIHRPKAELYKAWRNLKNLPLFMKHLKKVEEITNSRSRWSAQIPGRSNVIEWDVEITKEREGELLAWRSLTGGEIENEGEVLFRDALHGNATELYITISYRFLAGGAEKIFNKVFGGLVREDILRFKLAIETDRIAESTARKRKEMFIKKT